MPYTSLSRRNEPPSDRLKATLLERQNAYGIQDSAIYTAMGISRGTYYNRLKQHTDLWPLGELKAALQTVHAPLTVRTRNDDP